MMVLLHKKETYMHQWFVLRWIIVSLWIIQPNAIVTTCQALIVLLMGSVFNLDQQHWRKISLLRLNGVKCKMTVAVTMRLAFTFYPHLTAVLFFICLLLAKWLHLTLRHKMILLLVQCWCIWTMLIWVWKIQCHANWCVTWGADCWWHATVAVVPVQYQRSAGHIFLSQILLWNITKLNAADWAEYSGVLVLVVF